MPTREKRERKEEEVIPEEKKGGKFLDLCLSSNLYIISILSNVYERIKKNNNDI